MYGIFKATAELKKYPETAWNIVDADTDVKCIKIFETLEEAKEALNDYSARIDKNTYVITVYNCECYFVAEAELYDEDDGYVEHNVYPGNGYTITQLG